jgi:hypothetical protein
MKLGDQLQATITELEQAGIRAASEQAAADLKKVRADREARQFKLDQLKLNIVNLIKMDKVPFVKIDAYSEQKWFKDAHLGKAKNQELWTEFTKFFRNEKLEILINDQHDGQGMKSWITITVQPTKYADVYKGDLGAFTNIFGEEVMAPETPPSTSYGKPHQK